MTNKGVAKGTNNLASYGYTLDAAGHRTSVTELSGRTVNYSYDNLYRLTNETIAADPTNVNGAVGYTYDPVGNRTQMASTLPGVAAGLWNYDANDRFTVGDGYDNNGNTTSSGGINAVYDFENHLIQKGGVSIVYDGDGNRVSKTVAGVKTLYLVDTLNPTGYAQVIAEEAQNTAPTVPYVYGLERISQRRTVVINGTFTTQIRYFDYDGHGSVRGLTDPNGAVTDTYDYDAFGNLIHSTGTTQNVYLYSGEQFDPDLNLYYNRARYLNVSTGRFWSMDTFEGDPQAPSSLHKYVYATANPIGKRDPSGNDSLAEFSIATAAYTALATMAILSTAAAFNIAYGLTNLPKHPFSKPPDAAIVGFQVTANVGRALRKAAVTPVEVGLSIGLQFLSVGGGFEALFPKTFDAVWTYGYWGAFYSLPITGDSGTDGFVKDFPSISIAPNLNTDFLDAAAYAGAAWNTKTPQDYSGPFECVSGAIATRFAGISVRPDASVCSSPPKSDGTAGAYSLVLNRLGSGSSIGTSITSYSFLGSIHF